MVKEKRDPDRTDVTRATLQVSPEARDLFRVACESKAVDRSIGKAATNLVKWFVRQAPIVQTAITNDVDEGMERAYANALRSLADELEFVSIKINPNDLDGVRKSQMAAKPKGTKPHQQ